MHLVLEHVRVQTGVLEHKEALIPRRVVAHVLRDEFVHVDELVVEKAVYGNRLAKKKFTNIEQLKRFSLERLNRPLAMLPCMIVLGVRVQDFLRQTELTRRIVQPLDDHAPMVPHLVVLGIVHDYGLGVRQLGQQVHVERLENVAPVLPYRVVGRVQL